MTCHGNTSSGSRAGACGQTDRQTLICAFRDNANAPPKKTVSHCYGGKAKDVL